MAKLRIFVSSTCYDLDILRSELRPFITGLGYEPVMSDYSDVLFDHRSHTHESCLKEVPGCDMVLLIIGSRFGGTATPAALATIDFAAMEKLSTKSEILASKEKLSITQLEVLKAIEQGIPVHAFVDEKVLHDHHVYERNKDKKELIDQIDFPSIQKRETAKYIFEFINFLNHRLTNNGIVGFARLEEIRLHLLSQWSQMFQRLLYESRTTAREARRYSDFSERIDDLKAVVLASLATPGLRDTARGALEFRHLISFVSALGLEDQRALLLSSESWPDILRVAHIVRTEEPVNRDFPAEVFLIRDDGTFFRARYPRSVVREFADDWDGFRKLDANVREAIVDALLSDREIRRPFPMVRHVRKNFEAYMLERALSMTTEMAEKQENHDVPVAAPPVVG